MVHHRNLLPVPPPSAAEIKLKAWLPELWPLPQFEATQAGNTLRVFERGDDRLSNRGFGTLTRTDPVFQGLQRTRLLDPLLYFLGTNDQPGDYRSSGLHCLPRGLRQRPRPPRTPAPMPRTAISATAPLPTPPSPRMKKATPYSTV